jgi:curved DNA-binding protein CbpA
VKNYYKILEVDRSSSYDDIRLAYRNLAKKYHPDQNNDFANFTEIMQDINEAYSVLSKDDSRRKYNIQWDKIYGNQNKTHSQSQNQQKTSSSNSNSQRNYSQQKPNLNEYIWDGSNPKKYEAYENESFENYTNRILKNEKKDEFEKTADFQNRIEVLKIELLNNYLGEQNIKMNYEADSERFFITINEDLSFQIDVSIDLAKDFKNSVKNFYIKFSKELEILEVSTQFRGKKFLGKNFNKNWEIDIIKNSNYSANDFNQTNNTKRREIIVFIIFFIIVILLGLVSR